MSGGEPPRPLERAANEEAPPPARKPSRAAAMAVLLGATAAAVIVVSLSTSGTAPRRPAPADSSAGASAPAVLSLGGRPSGDLVQPSVAPRRRDPSPFDGPTTDSAVTACVAEVRAALPDADSVEVEEIFGDVDPTQGRADSLVVEGRAGSSVWHCASSRRQDGAVSARTTAVERIWGGTPTAFAAVHAVTLAAEESCMRAVSRIYRGYVFRGVQREQRGDTLHLSGDAFPLDNDLVRDFSCSATIRGGRIVDARARKSK